MATIAQSPHWIDPEDQADAECLADLRDLIVSLHPGLAGSRFRLLAAGWDCLGVDVDNRLLFKFPRNAAAAAALEREARMLDLVRPAVTLPVPDPMLVREPSLHSWHVKLPGEHLLPDHYDELPEGARARLAESLSRFFAELHAIPLTAALAAGAEPEPDWPPLDEVTRLALPLLPERLRTAGLAVVDAFAELGPDPLGEALGHFDVHGWNMAWDHAAQRLNGLYDFGDAGLGGPHLEFVATSLVSADLAARVMAGYERRTGCAVDPDRVWLLAGARRLRELAAEAIEPTSFASAQATRSVELAARSLGRRG